LGWYGTTSRGSFAFLWGFRKGSLQERFKGGVRASISHTIPYKPGRRMMTEVNATEFPDELLYVQTTMQMS